MRSFSFVFRFFNNKTTSVTNLTADESEFLNLINALRSESGFKPLLEDTSLQVASDNHTTYMVVNAILTHDEPAPNLSSGDRIANSGGNFSYSGENIAVGAIDAASVFEMWSGSPGHLANMLSPNYEFIGITSKGGYWTTDFGGI
jgi:uncharacterized protein YkwD